MTRLVTLGGYAVVAAGALGLELVARRSGRFPTFAEAVAVILRRLPLRVMVALAWLWLGWHLFVRVDWR
ncbi:MAG: DUF6186 family protein [Actinomycetota bacterium]|nr:DUF6186 family protein [Actinomycetota bacterium]